MSNSRWISSELRGVYTDINSPVVPPRKIEGGNPEGSPTSALAVLFPAGFWAFIEVANAKSKRKHGNEPGNIEELRVKKNLLQTKKLLGKLRDGSLISTGAL